MGEENPQIQPIVRHLNEEDYAIEREWIDPEIKGFVKTHKKWVIGIPVGLLLLILFTVAFTTIRSNQRETRLQTAYTELSARYEALASEVAFNYVEGSNGFLKDSVTRPLIEQEREAFKTLREETIQRMDVQNPSKYSEELEGVVKQLQSDLDNLRDKFLAKEAVNDLFEEPVIVEAEVRERPILKRNIPVERINQVNALIHEPTDTFWLSVGDVHNIAKNQQAIIANVKSFIGSMYDAETGGLSRDVTYDGLLINSKRIESINDPAMREEMYLSMEPAIKMALDGQIAKMYESNTGLVNRGTTPEELERVVNLIGLIRNFIVQSQYLEKVQPVAQAIQDVEAQRNVERAYQKALQDEEARNEGLNPSEDYRLDWYNSQPQEDAETGLIWEPAG